MTKILLVVIGVILVAAGAAWRPVAVPRLTKLPASLNQSAQLSGTYTSYENPQTGAPLGKPVQMPLTVTTTVKAVPADSTSSILVANESSAISAGPVRSVIVFQYALDRSTSENVRSKYAYVMTPSNVVDRTGTYSLGPPEGASPSKSYPIYVDDAGKAVQETSEHTTSTLDGLSVQGWQQNLGPTPMPSATAAAMRLPASMPFAAFAAQAKAAGVDLAGAFKDLMPVLTPAQRASLASVMAAPVPLQYLYSTQEKALVEPATGTTVDVASSVESVSVQPVLTHLAAVLTPILEAHATNPAAARLIASASKLTSVQATPLYTITDHQTPSSVAALTSQTKRNVTMLTALKLWVPIGLVVIGLILIIWGLAIRRRKKVKAAAPPPAAETAETAAAETQVEETTVEEEEPGETKQQPIT